MLAASCLLHACASDPDEQDTGTQDTMGQTESGSTGSVESSTSADMMGPPVVCDGPSGTGPEGTPVLGDPHWVGTWGASPQLTEESNEPPVSLAENTLRQFAYVSIGGSELRVQISNEFGDGPVTIDTVHLAAIATPPAIDLATDVALAFSGLPSVTIPAGEAVYSDPFAFDLVAHTRDTVVYTPTGARILSAIPCDLIVVG